MSSTAITVIPKVKKVHQTEVQEHESVCPDFNTLEMTEAKKEFFFRAVFENEVYKAGMSRFYDSVEITQFGASLRTKQNTIVYYATDVHTQWVAMIAEIYPFKHVHRVNFHFFIPDECFDVLMVNLHEDGDNVIATGGAYQEILKKFCSTNKDQ